jgi:hypothetical protein
MNAKTPDDPKEYLRQLQKDAAEAHRAGRLPANLMAQARKADDMAVALQSLAEPFDPDNQQGLPMLSQRALEEDTGSHNLEAILGNERLLEWAAAHNAIRSLAAAYRESAKLLRDMEGSGNPPEHQSKLEARTLYWLEELKEHTTGVIQSFGTLQQLQSDHFRHIMRYPEASPWEEKEQFRELQAETKSMRQLPQDELRKLIKQQVRKVAQTAPIVFQRALHDVAVAAASLQEQLPLERTATDLSLAIAQGLAPSRESKHKR